MINAVDFKTSHPSEISAYRRPSEELPTSFEKKEKKLYPNIQYVQVLVNLKKSFEITAY